MLRDRNRVDITFESDFLGMMRARQDSRKRMKVVAMTYEDDKEPVVHARDEMRPIIPVWGFWRGWVVWFDCCGRKGRINYL